MINVKNISVEDILLFSVLIHPEEEYSIPVISTPLWANEDSVISAIVAGAIQVLKNDVPVVGINNQIAVLKGDLPTPVESTFYPFAAKYLPDGRRLFKRVHGLSAVVAGAPDNIDFVIPYDNCKITGIEIIGGAKGDTVNLKILDTPTGTLSGSPAALLNQFGFNVNIAEGYYKHYSEYDADLIKDLKIRLEYDGINSDLLPKTVYVNIVLNEVKA